MSEMVHRAYKFRIYPNREQEHKLACTFGSCRLVYNHFLQRRKENYEQTGKSLSYNKCCAELVFLKKEKEFLKEVDSISLQQELRHLESAFDNFFRNPSFGYPRFKSQKDHNDSYSTVCVNGNLRLEKEKLILPKLGPVRIRLHRPVPEEGKLKSATVRRTPEGKYMVSLLFEWEEKKAGRKQTGEERILGLDFSAGQLFVSSDEDMITDPAFLHRYRKAQDKLRKAQKSLVRKQKGGKNREKQRCRLAACSANVANQRKDYLHKLSRQIANEWDVVCIEDLDMKEMAGKLKLGKSVGDDGWGMFTRFLDYKLTDAGKELIRINRWYPSSQICSCCGYQKKDLTLNDRRWECPCCRSIHDRDKNAAINIREEGRRIHLRKCA